MRWEDGIADAAREATDVEPGGAGTRLPVGVKPQELVTEPLLELAAASGCCWCRERREHRHAERLNQRRLAAPVTLSGVTEPGPDPHQGITSGLELGAGGLIEPGESNAPARGLEVRVKLVQLNRRVEPPLDEALEIRDDPFDEIQDRTQGPGRLRGLLIMRIARRSRRPCRMLAVSAMDGVGQLEVSDQSKHRFQVVR